MSSARVWLTRASFDDCHGRYWGDFRRWLGAEGGRVPSIDQSLCVFDKSSRRDAVRRRLGEGYGKTRRTHGKRTLQRIPRYCWLLLALTYRRYVFLTGWSTIEVEHIEISMHRDSRCDGGLYKCYRHDHPTPVAWWHVTFEVPASAITISWYSEDWGRPLPRSSLHKTLQTYYETADMFTLHCYNYLQHLFQLRWILVYAWAKFL